MEFAIVDSRIRATTRPSIHAFMQQAINIFIQWLLVCVFFFAIV